MPWRLSLCPPDRRRAARWVLRKRWRHSVLPPALPCALSHAPLARCSRSHPQRRPLAGSLMHCATLAAPDSEPQLSLIVHAIFRSTNLPSTPTGMVMAATCRSQWLRRAGSLGVTSHTRRSRRIEMVCCDGTIPALPLPYTPHISTTTITNPQPNRLQPLPRPTPTRLPRPRNAHPLQHPGP